MTSYYQKYYQENREKERARGKRWYESQDKQALYQKRKARQIELGQVNYYDRPERCFKYYKRNAEKRSIVFQLTLEHFRAFWKQPCVYCGENIPTIGLDRVDSLQGYTLANVVPCCKICNWMKNDLSREEFLIRCKRIIDHGQGADTNREP